MPELKPLWLLRDLVTLQWGAVVSGVRCGAMKAFSLTPRQKFLLVFFLFCLILQVTHDWTFFSKPLTPGAEDGAYIYADALQEPFWKTWLAPMVLPGYPPMGYVLLLQRIVGSIAAQFPPAYGPRALYVGTCALHILCAMYILSGRFSGYVRQIWVRSLIALFLVFLPTLLMYRGSITGSLQYLIVPVLALIAVAPRVKAAEAKTTVLDCLTLLICGFSCPTIVFLIPLFVYRLASDRDRHSLLICCIAALTGIIQLLLVFVSGRPGESDISRLANPGVLGLARYYVETTLIKVIGSALLGGVNMGDLGGEALYSTASYVFLSVFLAAVLILSLRLPGRFRLALIYLIFVPSLAAIFFYATKREFILDHVTKPTHGARYFFAGIAAVGVIILANLARKGRASGLANSVAFLLSALLASASMNDFRAPQTTDYDYYDWRRQAACLQGLRDGTRGTCWLTFLGGGANGWKRCVTAPIAIGKLGPLGTTDLVDYQVQFDSKTHEFFVNGWAADPVGPIYPAGVFASVEGVGDFRQFRQFNMIEIWEKLGGRARNDDMHTLGFTAKFPEAVVAPALKAGKPVTVRLKIAAFDLKGYYLAPYAYRINPDRAIVKIEE